MERTSYVACMDLESTSSPFRRTTDGHNLTSLSTKYRWLLDVRARRKGCRSVLERVLRRFQVEDWRASRWRIGVEDRSFPTDRPIQRARLDFEISNRPRNVPPRQNVPFRFVPSTDKKLACHAMTTRTFERGNRGQEYGFAMNKPSPFVGPGVSGGEEHFAEWIV